MSEANRAINADCVATSVDVCNPLGVAGNASGTVCEDNSAAVGNGMGAPATETKELPHTISPKLEVGLFGHVDSIGPTGITGWVIDLGNRTRALRIDAYLDDTLVASSETYLERPDVGSILGMTVTCGFFLPWDSKRLAGRIDGLPDEAPLHLRVILRGEDKRIGAVGLLSVEDLRKWQASLPPAPDQYFGRLETLSPYRISGFVVDRISPNNPVPLEISVDQKVVAEILADRERPDLAGTGIHVSCGFEWLVPREFHDGRSACVEVRVRDGDHSLRGSGARLTFPFHPSGGNSRRTGLDFTPGPLWTTGWAADTKSDDPLVVELFVDGTPFGKTLAGQYGPDLKDNPKYKFENAHTRFCFPTPRLALDGWMHEFLLYVPAWGSEPRARVMWARGGCFGHLDRCSGSIVSGWVAFRESPTRDLLATPVEISVDGKLAAQCFLGEERSDVAGTHDCHAAHAFKGDLGYPIAGSVSVSYAGVVLKGSPVQAGSAERLVGNLDGVAFDVITGWAADPDRPDGKVELELLIDGQVLSRFSPNHVRPDVQNLLKLPGSKVGFAIPTPDLLLDGEAHRAEVRFAANKQPLTSRVADVQFKRNFHVLESTDPHPVLSEFINRGQRIEPNVSETAVLSIVVLNRNGEYILNALLTSFIAVNSFERFEFIVVDHASEDASIRVLNEWSDRGIPIRVIPLPYNGSFSQSNNLAIRQYARGEYVLLLNNDIIFVQDILPEMIRTLQQNPRIGMVGIKLLDVVEDRGKNFYPPIQHLGIRYDDFGKRGILPYDEKLSPNSACDAFRSINPAGVTGAALLCRRAEYLAIGGLNEDFFYGYEDVDICLKYRVLSRLEIVCRNDLQALHHRGYSRLSGREMAVFEHLDRNHAVLMRRWGYAIGYFYRRSLTRGDRVYCSERLRIGFAVTETGVSAAAGDYFTALELARKLATFNHVEPVFLSERDDWYDLTDIHVLVVMRHDYDLRCIKNARADLTTVAWLRNHFEAWMLQKWFASFDICMSSARRFSDHLSSMGYPCETLPIATNFELMRAGKEDASLRCVAGFNGSAWAVPRKVVKVLEDAAASVPTVVVGNGWDGTSLKSNYKGFIPYERMPDFYASCDIIVDDANHSASLWGSANSRIFDALAAGKLVITNSSAAAADLFDGLLPVWDTPDEAVALIRKYSQDPKARRALAEQLREMVRASHTYEQRAASFLERLKQFASDSFRISIKIAVPNGEDKQWWGDWHFAKGLSKAFKARGHSARIDLLSDWDNPQRADDVVIVLRGLSRYTPNPRQINLLWIISHPDNVSVEECSKYDHVFSCSDKHSGYLASLGVNCTTLIQCADPEVMQKTRPKPELRREHLFVGNSRGQSRKIVTDLVSLNLNVAIFGRDWHGLAPDHMVEDDYIDNEKLGGYYGSAGVVYNDHWPDMARWGFLANRLFDAAASGAYIVSDKVDGLNEVFEGLISSYGTLAELAELSSPAAIDRWGPTHANALRELILSKHTFAHRVDSLLSRIRNLSEAKINGLNISDVFGPRTISNDRIPTNVGGV